MDWTIQALDFLEHQRGKVNRTSTRQSDKELFDKVYLQLKTVADQRSWPEITDMRFDVEDYEIRVERFLDQFVDEQEEDPTAQPDLNTINEFHQLERQFAAFEQQHGQVLGHTWRRKMQELADETGL